MILSEIKNHIKEFVAILVAILIICICALFSKCAALTESLDRFKQNEKAYIAENDSLTNTNRVFELTLDEFKHLNDSITLKLQDAIAENDVNQKKIKQLQYIASQTKTEMIEVIYHDTLFKEPSLKVDTVLTDGKWYSVNLGLYYPSTVSVLPSFNNEYYIIVNTRKETVDFPKKFFIARWFQKKQTILETTVVDNNPYSKIKENRFINIVTK